MVKPIVPFESSRRPLEKDDNGPDAPPLGADFAAASPALPTPAHAKIQGVVQKFAEMGFTHALAVGGALRDLDHGKPESEIADIDILINFHDLAYNDPDALKRARFPNWVLGILLNEKFGISVVVDKNLSSKRSADPSTDYHFRNEFKYDGFTIDVHAVPWPVSPESWFRYADFGLSRICMDKDGRIFKAPEYEFDKALKGFIIRASANEQDFQNSLVRFEKFQARYPEHGLGFPRSLASLYEKALEAAIDRDKKFSFEAYRKKIVRWESSFGSYEAAVDRNAWDKDRSPFMTKAGKDSDGDMKVYYPGSQKMVVLKDMVPLDQQTSKIETSAFTKKHILPGLRNLLRLK